METEARSVVKPRSEYVAKPGLNPKLSLPGANDLSCSLRYLPIGLRRLQTHETNPLCNFSIGWEEAGRHDLVTWQHNSFQSYFTTVGDRVASPVQRHNL